jgi:acetylornithine deacetylase/succinyl-diaminopimelate desuccinylase-like protein
MEQRLSVLYDVESRYPASQIRRGNSMQRLMTLGFTTVTLASLVCTIARADALTPQQQNAVDIYKELVEINTVTETGDTARAADAMAARLRAAGFADADVQVFKPAPRKGNLVARLHGTGARKPILLLAHIDVVEARPADWSTDPFKLVEKDGYFYGRGSGDDKYMAATFVANLIRYKQEGYRPDRDIILALETDEEILDADALGIQWLLKNHRDLIDAEFALNEGGGVGLKRGKPIRNSIQTSEKVTFSYRLGVTNKGGHSSVPSADNAIYHLAEGPRAAQQVQLSREPQSDDAPVVRTHRRTRNATDRYRYSLGSLGEP